MRRLLAPLAVAISVALFPAAAQATSNFPEIVKQQTGAPDLPFCDLCHSQGITGRGTVTTPFGAYMRSLGLVANQSNSLIKALNANKAAGSDVDGDGTGDWDELAVGRDPNVADTPAPVEDAGKSDAGPSDGGRADGGRADGGSSDGGADAGEISEDLGTGNGCSAATAPALDGSASLAAGAVVLAGLVSRGRRRPS